MSPSQHDTTPEAAQNKRSKSSMQHERVSGSL